MGQNEQDSGVPLSPPDGLPGWTVPQVARFVGVNQSTVNRWVIGVEINGHALQLATVVDAKRPQLGRFVAPKEWARFWAAYKRARSAPRPRKAAAARAA
jgi:hypothetical protein